MSVYVASYWALSILPQQKWYTESHYLITFKSGRSSAHPLTLPTSAQWKWALSHITLLALRRLISSTPCWTPLTLEKWERRKEKYYLVAVECTQKPSSQVGPTNPKGEGSRVLTSLLPPSHSILLRPAGGEVSASHWSLLTWGWGHWNTDSLTSHYFGHFTGALRDPTSTGGG